MQLADEADDDAAARDRRAAARMQRRMRGAVEARERRRGGGPERREQRLDVGLHVEEVDGPRRMREAPLIGRRVAPSDGADLQRLRDAGHRRRPVGDRRVAPIDLRDLEHPHARRLAVRVEAHVRDEAADERRPHHRERRRDRVQQPDRVVVAGEVALPRVLDEAEVDRLAIVAGRERVGDRVDAAPPPRAARASRRARPAAAPGSSRSRGRARLPRSGLPRSRGRSDTAAARPRTPRRRRGPSARRSRPKLSKIAAISSAAIGRPITRRARATRIADRLALRQRDDLIVDRPDDASHRCRRCRRRAA